MISSLLENWIKKEMIATNKAIFPILYEKNKIVIRLLKINLV